MSRRKDCADGAHVPSGQRLQRVVANSPLHVPGGHVAHKAEPSATL